MMDVIILEGPQGIRSILSGVAYRLLPGEKRIGSKIVKGNMRKCSNCKRMGVFEFT